MREDIENPIEPPPDPLDPEPEFTKLTRSILVTMLVVLLLIGIALLHPTCLSKGQKKTERETNDTEEAIQKKETCCETCCEICGETAGVEEAGSN